MTRVAAFRVNGYQNGSTTAAVYNLISLEVRGDRKIFEPSRILQGYRVVRNSYRELEDFRGGTFVLQYNN